MSKRYNSGAKKELKKSDSKPLTHMLGGRKCISYETLENCRKGGDEKYEMLAELGGDVVGDNYVITYEVPQDQRIEPNTPEVRQVTYDLKLIYPRLPMQTKDDQTHYEGWEVGTEIDMPLETPRLQKHMEEFDYYLRNGLTFGPKTEGAVSGSSGFKNLNLNTIEPKKEKWTPSPLYLKLNGRVLLKNDKVFIQSDQKYKRETCSLKVFTKKNDNVHLAVDKLALHVKESVEKMWGKPVEMKSPIYESKSYGERVFSDRGDSLFLKWPQTVSVQLGLLKGEKGLVMDMNEFNGRCLNSRADIVVRVNLWCQERLIDPTGIATKLVVGMVFHVVHVNVRKMLIDKVDVEAAKLGVHATLKCLE